MKNIVIFSDGTGQTGGSDHNTNVYKLFNLILERSPNQISYYDPGIGTNWEKVSGNVLGKGFSKNILDCYRFIFENYEAGDKIYLFGFSRGAATVRSLSGFLHLFGVLPRARKDLINKAWAIYKTGNSDKRRTKAESLLQNNHTMWAKIQFLGVWDTVAALGLPDTKIDKVLDWIIPYGFHDFHLSDSVLHACHALALDDVRKDFHPVFFEPEIKSYQTLKQVWFMGMHTDVGGGYREHGLSDIALEWMVLNAVQHGLHIYNNPRRKNAVCFPNPDGIMHDARNSWWKKIVFKEKSRWWDARFGDAVIHGSVKERTLDTSNSEGTYEPWIMKHDPETEPWLHLEDFQPNQDEAPFGDDLNALNGWCEPVSLRD